MSIFKSIGGIAKQVSGKVGGFRAILNANPQALSFVLPPQVSIGLMAAKELNSALGGKLKIPSLDDFKKAEKGVNDILGGVDALQNRNSSARLGSVLQGGTVNTFPGADGDFSFGRPGQITKGQLNDLLQGSFTKTFPNADSSLSLDPKNKSIQDAINQIKSGADLLNSLDWLL